MCNLEVTGQYRILAVYIQLPLKARRRSVMRYQPPRDRWKLSSSRPNDGLIWFGLLAVMESRHLHVQPWQTRHPLLTCQFRSGRQESCSVPAPADIAAAADEIQSPTSGSDRLPITTATQFTAAVQTREHSREARSAAPEGRLCVIPAAQTPAVGPLCSAAPRRCAFYRSPTPPDL